jgi:hypothetical protein
VGIFNVLKTLFVAHVFNFLGRLDFASGLPLLGKAARAALKSLRDPLAAYLRRLAHNLFALF